MKGKCHLGSPSACWAKTNRIGPSSSRTFICTGLGVPGNYRKWDTDALLLFFFCFQMLKLMCHCEDSKQMGKGQGFFVAECVSMATAYVCLIRKHHLFGCGGSLGKGGAPLPRRGLGGLFLFDFSTDSENHRDRLQHKYTW